MFEKLARPVARQTQTKTTELPKTTAFLQSVVTHGFRLSYGGLAVAARILGEDNSNQIIAQRGAGLVKGLPAEIQPFVCQRSGGYSKGIQWAVETPADLRSRPVITEDVVGAAVAEWKAAMAASTAALAPGEG